MPLRKANFDGRAIIWGGLYMLKIYRGDDTNFKGIRTINVVLKDAQFSLDGCYGEFDLCGQRTKVSPLVVGVPMPIVFNHFQTETMPFGENFGYFRIIDERRRRRTVASRIPVIVSSVADEVYGTDNCVEIRVSEPYSSLSDKPKIGGHELKGGENGYQELELVSKVNGKGCDKDGNVRLPKIFFTNEKPDTDETYDELPENHIAGDRLLVLSSGMVYVLAEFIDSSKYYKWIEVKSDVNVLKGVSLKISTDDEIRYAIGVVIESLGGAVIP